MGSSEKVLAESFRGGRWVVAELVLCRPRPAYCSGFAFQTPLVLRFVQTCRDSAVMMMLLGFGIRMRATRAQRVPQKLQ